MNQTPNEVPVKELANQLYTDWCESAPYGEQVPEKLGDLFSAFCAQHAGKSADQMFDAFMDVGSDDPMEQLFALIFTTGAAFAIDHTRAPLPASVPSGGAAEQDAFKQWNDAKFRTLLAADADTWYYSDAHKRMAWDAGVEYGRRNTPAPAPIGETPEQERKVWYPDFREDRAVIADLTNECKELRRERDKALADLAALRSDYKNLKQSALDAGCVEVEVCSGCGKPSPCPSDCPCGTGKTLTHPDLSALREKAENDLMRAIDICTGHGEPMPSLARVEEYLRAALTAYTGKEAK